MSLGPTQKFEFPVVIGCSSGFRQSCLSRARLGGLPVACSPEAGPCVMRVKGPELVKETLDEEDET